MIRKSAAIALAAATALVLSACSSSTPEPNASGSVDTDATLTVRLVLQPGNLDIRETAGAGLDQALFDNVYQGLVGRTAEGKIVPVLASEYTISPDGLRYEFTVREGVTFHDGSDLSPEDVVTSLSDVKNTASYTDSGRLERIEKIEAEGQKVVLTLSEADSTLLWNLTGRAGLIFKKDDKTDRKKSENGTGPYTLKSWKEGDSITLTRYDKYWGDKPQLSEVVFAYVPENQAALNGALAGDFDVLTGFDADFKDQVEANGAFSLVLGASTDKGTLAINSTSPKLADKRVRQAIRQAIDHRAIIASTPSRGTELYGPIPESDPGYEDLSDVAPYDPEAARTLLKEAGAEKLKLNLTIPNFYGTTLPQLLVSQFHAVGIELTVTSVEFPTWVEDVYKQKNYELSFVMHTEARDFENWANPGYYFNYDNAEVQKLYEESRAATSDDEAEALLRKAARIVSEDAPADWISNWNSVIAVAPHVSGFPHDNVNARINLAGVTVTK